MEQALSSSGEPDEVDEPREPREHVTARSRQLVEEFYQPLRRFAAVVAPLDVDPDDLLHDAFLRALRVRPLESFEYPSAYLRRTMLSLASNQRRAFARLKRVVTRLSRKDDLSERPHYPSDVSELLRLTPRDRALLWMADVEGRPFAEIASVLRCSEEAARTRASRCRRRLRKALIEKDA